MIIAQQPPKQRSRRIFLPAQRDSQREKESGRTSKYFSPFSRPRLQSSPSACDRCTISPTWYFRIPPQRHRRSSINWLDCRTVCSRAGRGGWRLRDSILRRKLCKERTPFFIHDGTASSPSWGGKTSKHGISRQVQVRQGALSLLSNPLLS